MSRDGHNAALASRHRRTAIWCGALVVAMVGAAYAAVPLYRMFCEATGFDGTPRIASKPSDTVLERTINIRFDANLAPGMGWSFEPVQRTIDVKLGETTLVFYRASNTSDHPITGTATFNVFPEQSAPFFNKLQCFCFTEQTLEPGQSIEMPVSFFIDPAIVNDKDARGTTHITLSYTFYPVVPKPGLAQKRDGKTG
ncbi:MAG: cytochrome c oxidase assembly protein [Hyphomicrobiaceae bacterium]|nr:cytochrome c oxidase assembly protein [Hyphomicrobiaceae bacterium]